MRFLKIFSIFCMCLLAPSWLLAHASLVQTSPEAGSVLDKAPDTITLTFNEPVGISKLDMYAPNGDRVKFKDTKANNQTLTIQPASIHSQGTYLLSWRVISADGHPVGGTLDFALAKASNNQAAANHAQDSITRDSFIWLARWLGYVSLFAVIGAAFFRMIVPQDKHPWLRPVWITAIFLLIVNLAFEALDASAVGVSQLAHWPTWQIALQTSYAWTLGLMLAALISALLALRANSQGILRGFALLSLMLTGAALATSGHASTAPPEWLARPLVAIHIICVITWIGTLIPLWRSLKPNQQGTHGLRSFSAWIVPAVMLIILSGAGLAWLQLDRLSDLWQTAYGRILAGKLLLIALLLLIAAVNRFSLTKPSLAANLTSQGRLKRAILIEIVLAIMILGVVSLWRLTPPPRSLDAQAQSLPLMQFELANDKIEAQVKLEENGTDWTITLEDLDHKPFKAQQVQLALSNPEAHISSVERRGIRIRKGTWQAHFPALPTTGQWEAKLEVLIDDFTQSVLYAKEPSMQHQHTDHADVTMPAHAHHHHTQNADARKLSTAKDIHISRCWVRLMPASVPSGGYFKLINQSDVDKQLNGVTTPGFKQAMLHQTANGGMHIVDSIDIKPGQTLAFTPGDYHIMLEEPKSDLKTGDTLEMNFIFADHTKAYTTCDVRPATTSSDE